MEVVKAGLAITDQAFMRPTVKDWTPDIRRSFADPAASLTLSSIASVKAAGVHETKPSTYSEPIVTSVDDKTVTAMVCVDTSTQVVVDGKGEKLPGATGSTKVQQTFTVAFYGSAGWLIREKKTSATACH